MIRKMFIILACALALACSNNPGTSPASNSSAGAQASQTASGEIVFNFVQPVGQKSLYSMIVDTSATNDTPSGPQAVNFKMSTDFATEVTESNQDGTWSMKNSFSNVSIDATQNGNRVQMPTSMIEGKSFTTTMDRTGQIVRTSESDLAGGINLDQMFSQMNVSAMLPKKPVRVGESWPFEMRQELPNPAGGTSTQVITGSGKLTGVSNNEAQVEYQFKVQITGPMSGEGPGTGTISYDLGRARVVTSKSDLEISGEMNLPGSTRPLKSTTKASTDMRLRGE